MIRVLFICHGNICRSPMAEFVMKNHVAQRGLQNQIQVESAATTNDDLGADMYWKAKETLDKHHIPYTSRHAKRMRTEDYNRFDHIFVMDQENLEDMQWILPGDPEQKIEKLNATDVEDPWYTRNFEKVYREINEGCLHRLEQIEKEIQKG